MLKGSTQRRETLISGKVVFIMTVHDVKMDFESNFTAADQ
jgi:hypothetical protein